VIPNGVDLDAYRSGGQRHRQRVAFVGRDDPRKGFSVLLAAWEQVRAVIPGAELIAIGPEGQDRPGIRFVGRGTNQAKSEWLQSSEIFVAPNLGGESFGLVLAEGMAAGCAVIASDLAAFRYVTAGTARLVPSGESRPLAAALVDLLTHPGQTTAMGERARERARAFGWARVFPMYRSAYLEAIELFDTGR